MSEKTFKSMKNTGFGASNLEKLAPGDIVTWKTWEVSLESEVFETREGLLVDIFEEKRHENLVFMAKIMPFGQEKEVILPLISVRKSNKQDYL
jgi:hypothetical protein